MLEACGREDEARGVLSNAKREAARGGDAAGLARIELALAEGALTRGDVARARSHVAALRRREALEGLAAHAWLAEARLARLEGRAPPAWPGLDPGGDSTDRRELAAEIALERALGASAAGADGAEVQVRFEEARALAAAARSPRLVALVEVEIGLRIAQVDDAVVGAARVRAAVELLGAAGLRGDEARAKSVLAARVASWNETIDAATDAALRASSEPSKVDRLAARLLARARASLAPSSSPAPSSDAIGRRAGSTPALSPSESIAPLAEVEKRAYMHALERCNQNVARASEALGVSRVTFYAKLRAWGMHPRDRYEDETPTSVRRQRAIDPARRPGDAAGAKAPEPFEPPTRTSKVPRRDE
jgi:hypothetical protein